MSDSEIIEKYYNLVYYMARQRADNPSDVDDIVQEVFLRYVDSSPKFPNEKAARKWFSVVTGRVAINFCTTAQRRYEVDITEEEYEEQPSDRDLIAEVEDRLLTAGQMERLQPISRQVLFLRFDCGYSIKEVANAIGENLSRTKALLMRGAREYRRIVFETESKKGDDAQ